MFFLLFMNHVCRLMSMMMFIYFVPSETVFVSFIYTLNFIFNDMHHCIPIPATTIDLPSTMLLMFCFLFYQLFPKSVILYSCLWSRFLALGCSGVLVIFPHFLLFFSRALQPLLAYIIKRQVTLNPC